MRSPAPVTVRIDVPTPTDCRIREPTAAHRDPGQQLAHPERALGQQAEDGEERDGIDGERKRQSAPRARPPPDGSPDRQAAEHRRSDQQDGEHRERHGQLYARERIGPRWPSRGTLQSSWNARASASMTPRPAYALPRGPPRARSRCPSGFHLVVQLGPDHRDAGERGIDDVRLQRRIALQHESQHRDEHEQERNSEKNA